MRKTFLLAAVFLTLTSCYKGELEDLQSDYDLLELQHSELNSSTQRIIDDLTSSLESKVQEILELQDIIAASEEDAEVITFLKSKLQEQAKTIQEITAQLDFYVNQANENDSVIDILESSLNAAMDNYSEELSELMAQLEAANEQTEADEEYIEELEKTIDRLQKQVDRLVKLIEKFIDKLND